MEPFDRTVDGGASRMKLAASFQRGTRDSVDVALRMGDALVVRDDQARRRFDCGDGAIEGVMNTTSEFERGLVHQSDSGNILLVSGVPMASSGLLSSIARLDLSEASKRLSELDGAFAALFWDAAARRLAIVTDCLGMQPLYYARPTDGGLLLSSDLKGIAASGRIDIDLAPKGWGAFWMHAYCLEDDTMLRGVERIPGGHVSIYDPADDSLESRQYWRWPASNVGQTIDSVDTGAMIEILERECTAYLESGVPSVVLLSGGADSRLIAAVLQRLGADPRALIFAHEGEELGADGRFGVQVAEACGLPWELRAGDPGFYSSQPYLDLLAMNEVTTPSLRHFVSSVLAAITPDLGAVWDGAFLGTTLKTGTRDTLRICLTPKRGNPQGVLRSVLARDLAEQCLDDLDARKNDLYDRYGQSGHAVMQHLNRSYKRNRTAPNALKVAANHVFGFTPGMSRDWWNLTSTIPRELKNDLLLYRTIFERHFPHLTSLPLISGGKLAARPQGSRLSEWTRWMDQRFGRKRPRRKPTARPRFFGRSELVAPIIACVDAEHPDLNPETVLRLQEQLRQDPLAQSNETELLFYWQVWRWIMEGQRDRLNAERLLPDASMRTPGSVAGGSRAGAAP